MYVYIYVYYGVSRGPKKGMSGEPRKGKERHIYIYTKERDDVHPENVEAMYVQDFS